MEQIWRQPLFENPTRLAHKRSQYPRHATFYQRWLPHYNIHMGWIHSKSEAIEGHRHEMPVEGGHWHAKCFHSRNHVELELLAHITHNKRVGFPHTTKGEPAWVYQLVEVSYNTIKWLEFKWILPSHQLQFSSNCPMNWPLASAQLVHIFIQHNEGPPTILSPEKFDFA